MALIPELIKNAPCRVGYSEGKGRGVFATDEIPSQTVIEVSPVLLFTKEEYINHGKYTLLDHYTFNWPDGRMALALGIGSLFNHDASPNVSFILDTSAESIRYITSRKIQSGEELSIFYGHSLWFKSVGSSTIFMNDADEQNDDTWGGLTEIEGGDNPYSNGKKDEIISEEELPIVRTKITPDEEEDISDAITTMPAWAVKVPDPRMINALLKWIKQAGLETPELQHLKRIRNSPDTGSLLLLSDGLESPKVPPELNLPEPFLVDVPVFPARTVDHLTLKNQIWPTVYAPRRKNQPNPWSRAKVAWAWDAINVLLTEARKADKAGEIPIVSYVPPPIESDNLDDVPSFIAYDTRRTAGHPLRHSVMNAVRQVGDWRAKASDSTASIRIPMTSTPEPSDLGNSSGISGTSNGTNYLLTSLTLFTTHEPCIMCSMALLHSRVKEIVYITPMDKTGGCGGSTGHGTCVPRLKGVNHRYGIARWTGCNVNRDRLPRVDDNIDA